MSSFLVSLVKQNPFSAITSVTGLLCYNRASNTESSYDGDGVFVRDTLTGKVNFKRAYDIHHHEIGWLYNDINDGKTPDSNRLGTHYHASVCPNAPWRERVEENKVYKAGLALVTEGVKNYMNANNISTERPNGCYQCIYAPTEPFNTQE